MITKTNLNYFQRRPNIECCSIINLYHTGNPFGFTEHLFGKESDNERKPK